MRAKLKPCPVCGKRPYVYRFGDAFEPGSRNLVYCAKRQDHSINVWASTPARLVSKWNSLYRPQPKRKANR